jgi:hypothetical protein
MEVMPRYLCGGRNDDHEKPAAMWMAGGLAEPRKAHVLVSSITAVRPRGVVTLGRRTWMKGRT